jgi:hypothetical protein
MKQKAFHPGYFKISNTGISVTTIISTASGAIGIMSMIAANENLSIIRFIQMPIESK